MDGFIQSFLSVQVYILHFSSLPTDDASWEIMTDAEYAYKYHIKSHLRLTMSTAAQVLNERQ
jgi:hypothetical protein